MHLEPLKVSDAPRHALVTVRTLAKLLLSGPQKRSLNKAEAGQLRPGRAPNLVCGLSVRSTRSECDSFFVLSFLEGSGNPFKNPVPCMVII